jgi:hypothetical protein
MMQRPAFFLLFFWFKLSVLAQHGLVGHPGWYIRPCFNQGYVLVHRISIGHLVKGYPAIYELDFVKPTLGNKLWQVQNNLPDLGISAQCIDYKNPSQLGYGFVLAPFVELPFRGAHKRARLIMRMSWGVAYLTRKFDIASNHKNIAIGSNVNAFAQFKWFWHIPLGERLRFEPGFSFTHASNGKFRNPNLGINVVSINLGLTCRFPGKKPVPQITGIDSMARAKKKNELLFFAAGGFNERLTNTGLLRTLVLSGAWQRNLNNKNKLSLGLDAFYDENYLTDFELRAGEPLVGLQQWRFAARLGYSYNVGNLSFPFEMGFYVRQFSEPDGAIVNRIGMRYYLNNGLVAHMGLRTHFAVAYNFEFGLGYRLYL